MADSYTEEPEILTKVSFFKSESPLLQFASNVTSQSGEDGIIAKIADTLNVERRFCVEFGAWDGKLYSNCYNLTTAHRWSGLMIEADSEKFTELERLYESRADVQTVNTLVEIEGENSLDSILAANYAPEDFALLSIDIDGMDYHIWKSLENYTPEIVVIEFNPSVPNDVVFVQAKSNNVNQGCSLLALIILGKEKGYELACCTSTNAIFVKGNRLQELGVVDNHINTLFQYPIDGRIFHGYDSTVYVVGMPYLMWNDKVLDQEDFQVLPPSERKFKERSSTVELTPFNRFLTSDYLKD